MADLKFDENGMLVVPDGIFDENGNFIRPGQAEATAQGATPGPVVEVEADTEEGQSFLERTGEVLRDMGRGAVDGVQEGLVEMAETVGWVGDEAAFAATELLTGEPRNYYLGEGWLTREEVETANREGRHLGWQPVAAIDGATDIEGAETMAGQMTSGVTQFLTGYGVAGQAFKAARIAPAATRIGQIGRATGQGAVADFSAFDPHEDRFSDFLRDNVGLQDPITEFLSADESDTDLEGRLKNALEGAALGVATDAVFGLVRGYRQSLRIRAKEGPEAAAEHMDQVAADMIDDGTLPVNEAGELQLDLFDTVSDPNLRESAEGVVTSREVLEGSPEVSPRAPEAEEAGGVTLANAGDAPARPAVETERLRGALDREIAMRRAGSLPDPERSVGGSMFNFDRMDQDADVLDVINMAAEEADTVRKAHPTTFDEIASDARTYLADAADVDPEVIERSLARTAGDSDKLAATIVAGRSYVQSLAAEVERLAYGINNGSGNSDETYERFIRMSARLVEVEGNLKSTITGAAQATASGRIRTTDVLTGQQLTPGDIVRQMRDNINGAGGSGALDDMARLIVKNKEAGNGVRGLMRITEGATRSMDYVNEIWINALLSGPRTHLINAISNGAQMMLLPTERVLGGIRTGNRDQIAEGARTFAGLAQSLRDSFRLTRMAFKDGHNILDPEAAILEANGNDIRAIRSNSRNVLTRGAVNTIGTAIRLPSRFLTAGDEFFKQMTYRANLYAELMGEANELVRNGQIARDEAGRYVSDRMSTAFARDGSAASQRHLDLAREATFTQPLPGARGEAHSVTRLSRGIQNLTNQHPALKLILPFVRTPTNILRAWGQRTPVLNRLSKSLNADLRSGDPRRVAAARGKMMTGNVLWGSALLAAYQGNMTGGGPRDSALRQRMMETGWRPYSFVVRKDDGSVEYVDYSRMDPFGVTIGIAADIAEVGGQVGDAEMEEIALAAVTGLANNITSKTYMTGLSDAIEALNDPQRYGQRLAQNYASGIIPFSSFLRQMRRDGDPAMRDVRTVLDSVRNTLPGMSDELPARRSWVTGEPVMYPQGWGKDLVNPIGEAFSSYNPIMQGDWKQDLVLDELASLNYGFSAPTRKIQGVELTAQQYERLLELHGTIRDGRYTMYQRLERLIDSSAYQKMDPTGDPETDPRIRAVRRVVTGYRDAARRQLMKENPDIIDQIEAVQSEAASAARGRYNGIADLAQ